MKLMIHSPFVLFVRVKTKCVGFDFISCFFYGANFKSIKRYSLHYERGMMNKRLNECFLCFFFFARLKFISCSLGFVRTLKRKSISNSRLHCCIFQCVEKSGYTTICKQVLPATFRSINRLQIHPK